MTSPSQIAANIRMVLESDQSLPMPYRALIAGVLMCARGGAPSRLGMAKVGGYSYGSSQNHYAELLNALVERLPAVVGNMASTEMDPVSAAKLRHDLRQRDDTIGELRKELAERKSSQEELRKYALALHKRVAEVESQEAAEANRSVRTLRPLL